MSEPVVPDDFLAMLRCPEDRSALTRADDALVAQVNAAIAAGGVTDRDGEPVKEPIEAGLVRADGQWLYPVRDQTPVLLKGAAIDVTRLADRADEG